MEHDHEPKKRPRFDLFFSYMDARKPSDRLLIYVLLLVTIAAGSWGLISLNNRYTTSVPAEGGTFVEGIVGTPRFVNPVLALTRVDNDLSALLYSGLVKIDENGDLQPDLAESVTVSEDGLVYNIILRDDIRFHDDTPIRSDDVAFTIDLLQNAEIKSPLRGNWSGVTVEVIDERELNLVLQNPYTPFIENLTIGIMPKHIWQALSVEELPFSQHNTEPVGSGPYALEEISRNDAGFISEYLLSPFEDGRENPKIGAITVRFYQNEDELATAFKAGSITGTAGLSYDAVREVSSGDGVLITAVPLPRIFSVFFNQNKSPVLRDQSAREALDIVIDRNALIEEVLSGYGEPATSPIPPSVELAASTTMPEVPPATSSLKSLAETILVDGGWTKSELGRWTKEIDGADTTLAITIATANADVFEETAYYLERAWTDLGAEVSVELYEQSDLVQSVIRPRDYEALLFGTEIGRALDLYPFWHSSQREDPGLNVALYTNITADALLETARTTRDETERDAALASFAEEIGRETPALFLYSPSFVYATRNVTLPEMTGIARPHERFSNIGAWHMKEESVWNIFAY